MGVRIPSKQPLTRMLQLREASVTTSFLIFCLSISNLTDHMCLTSHIQNGWGFSCIGTIAIMTFVLPPQSQHCCYAVLTAVDLNEFAHNLQNTVELYHLS